ncbi:transcription repressor NadR [Jeotgalibacillus proteolyticus]|uniref:Transcription repressor NadR n=1 Tax=Jeotgalibacillus proteolyticus TaxID=2082395 RepID=A0A2S5GF33_9BACL|nr:transcription repressor NadR [Jeotgalibacillus proteolyticus]PPA71531.1 transcription repressor NadR [Jeotgalibacillus proteolyticus]
MPRDQKVSGETRRQTILENLKVSASPITGNELAAKMKVSRQVIVSDITLLKAKQEPILATSQGYLYMPSNPPVKAVRTIVCRHKPEQSEEEMRIIVEAGASIKNVSIEHPVYGDLTASMMIFTTDDVTQFISKIKSTDASFLSELTGGVHLHEIEADSESILQQVEEKLFKARILVKD